MSSLDSERAERIAELEKRLERSPPTGARPWLSLAGLALVAYLLAFPLRLPLSYVFASSEPVVLGGEGSYRPDLFRSNRYAMIRGIPTVRGTYFREGSETFTVVGLVDSPLLVLRHSLPTEKWDGTGTPPPPDPRAFTALGRLLAAADAPRYAEAFRKIDEMGQVKPKWILIAGDAPRGDWSALLAASALGLFAVFNAVTLIRGLRRPGGNAPR